MVVRCPKCRTTYKVSDELLKGGAPAFRCSRCKHTFDLEARNDAELKLEESAQPPSSGNPDKELSLPFEPRQTEMDNGAGGSLSISTSPEIDGGHASQEEAWTIPNASGNPPPDFVVPQEEPAAPTSFKRIEIEKDFPKDDAFFARTTSDDSASDSDNILAISSYLDQRASILPFISLFCLLTIGFALFSLISYANPRNSEAMIRNIPVLGPAVLRNNHLREGIVVQSLSSSYQTIQGNREVFLVSGVAINQNPEVVREIQLTGVAYNESGKELEQQTIWAGNTISPKIIRGMTIEDIPHLQDLKPLKTFELPPGDSIPFTIVFLKSAKNAKAFSCKVLAAEGGM